MVAARNLPANDAEACPTRFVLTEDWRLDDPAGQPIEKVGEIGERVEELLNRLARG